MDEPHGGFNRRGFLGALGGALAMSGPGRASAVPSHARQSAPPAGASAAQLAEDEDFWFNVQQSFAVGRGILNLNNGGVSPSPRVVTDALVRYQWAQEDATAYTMWQLLEPQSESVRRGLATLFGADPEEIAITRNASESLEILLMGLDLKPGDEILTTTQDYPRMLTTLRQRERREGLILKMVKIPVPATDAADIVSAFERGITAKTRLILVSHVVNITGQITPVKSICALARARGVETMVDGAHSFALLDFKRDDLGCDYYGTSLHKWLMAPKGTGLLYVRRDRIEKLWPLFAAEAKQAGDIRKFEEIGTHSAAPRLAIGEALTFHEGIGPRRKEARMRHLARYWMKRLVQVPGVHFNTSFDDRQSCAVANVRLDKVDPAALGDHLMKAHRILVATIGHDECAGIRVTPNVYTTLGELDRFCEVMERLARRGLPK